MQLQVNRVYTLLLSHNALAHLLGDGETRLDPREVYLYRDGVSLARHEYPWETLRHEAFPLLQSGYLRRLSEKNITDVMARLYLNPALKRLFMATTEQAYSSVELISLEKQLAISALWANRVYQFDANSHCTLGDSFYRRLSKLALFATATPAERVQIVFCLATVFAKCASNNLFGTEEDSPFALRSLACALLDRAITLPDGVAVAAQECTVWKNSLLGRQGELTCAAVVTDEMLDYASVHFPVVLQQIMPVDWR